MGPVSIFPFSYSNTCTNASLFPQKATELFDVIVMHSKATDGGTPSEPRGYAIDRFPRMSDDKIEAAHMRKTERIARRNKEIRKQVLSGAPEVVPG